MTHEKSDASRPNSSETDCASLTGSSAASASERGDAKHDDSLPIPFMFASRETAVDQSLQDALESALVLAGG
jgi:hypothetical protein